MSAILKIPGCGCRFYRSGHCLLAEYKNPGLDPDLVCLVLRRLERRFDIFLDGCDQAGTGLEAATRIWQTWVGRAVEWNCPDYVLVPEKAGDICLYFTQGLCLLRFPLCAGRCRYYELDRTDQNLEEPFDV